jgi:hypothetical protein
MAFPELFPTGEFGIRDARRQVKITNSDYIKSRLLNRDPKVRHNKTYILHLFHLQELSAMVHAVGYMLRTVSGNKLTAKALHDRLSNRDGELENKLFSMMANIRGLRQYFSKLATDVKLLITKLGPPTLFLTVSTAEWSNDALIAYMRTTNASIPQVNSMTPSELCAMDPVSVSLHFQKKCRAIFSKLIKGKNPIFGTITDFFWRIEYQARGAPHVHCILWVEGAPMLGKDSIDDVQQYIERIATGRKPDADESPLLTDLVNRHQVHKMLQILYQNLQTNWKVFQKMFS